MSPGDTSVVLVHGAWADGYSWSKVIPFLSAAGVPAVIAPLPLTSLTDDVAALDRTLARIDGAAVVVGHAYGGAVIASTRHRNIRSLVYVAALAPAEGETVAEVFYRAAPEQDRMIAPDTQRFMAQRMQARARSYPVDHTPSVTAPRLVAELILDAVNPSIAANTSPQEKFA